MATYWKEEVKSSPPSSGKQVGTGTRRPDVSQRFRAIQRTATDETSNVSGLASSRHTNKPQTGIVRKEAWSADSVHNVSGDEVMGNAAPASTGRREKIANVKQAVMKLFKDCESLIIDLFKEIEEDERRTATPTEQPQSPGRLTDVYYNKTMALSKENAALKDDLKNQTGVGEQLRNDNAELQQEKEDVVRKYNALAKELRRQKAEFSAERKQMVANMAALEEKVKLAENQIKQKEEEYQNSIEELKTLRTKLQKADTLEVDTSQRPTQKTVTESVQMNEAYSVLELHLKNAKENVEELQRKNLGLLQENENLILKQISFEKQQQTQASELAQYKEQLSRLEETIAHVDSQIKQKEEENQQLSLEVKSLRTQMQEQQSRAQPSEGKLGSKYYNAYVQMKENNATLDLELQKQKETTETLLKENKDLLQEKKTLESELQQSRAQLSDGKLASKYYNAYVRMKENNATLDLELQKQKETIETIFKENEHLLQENKTLQSEQVSATKEQQKFQERVDKFFQQISTEKSALEQNLKDAESQMRQKDIEYQHAKAELNQLRSTANKAEEAKKDALSRLSRQMGQKMTEGNAAIADLSDKDRPTKLAERYNEIYDNVWTDSLGSLTEERHESDSAAVEILLNILMDSFDYCSKTVDKQTSDLYMDLLQCDRVDEDALPSDLKTLVKDAKKASGSLAYKNVFKAFKRKLESGASSHERSARYVEEYVQECFEVCWQMCLRDPPLVLAPLPMPGDRLESDFYKEYTVSGSEVDYVVWPALLLHKDGPLLGKGVVQPKQDTRQRSKSARERRNLVLHTEHVSSTPPPASNSEQIVLNRNAYSGKPFLARSGVPYATKINSQTDQSVGSYGAGQTNPTPRTNTGGGANINFSPGSRITKDQPVTRDTYTESTFTVDRPQISEAAVHTFVSYYNKNGYEWCQSAYGEKRSEKYYHAARRMRLL